MAESRKKRLTLEEHKAIGGELKAMRDRLVTLAVQLDGIYPVKTKVAAKATKAQGTIDDLRSLLDGLVFAELMGQMDDKEIASIYYPGSK